MVRRDITEIINACDTEKYEKRPIKLKYKVTPTINNPFEKLIIDSFRYNKQSFLTNMESFSKRFLGYI